VARTCGPATSGRRRSTILVPRCVNWRMCGGRALVDHSRAIFPRPACGERVGVRGVLATAQHPQVSRKLPLTREPCRGRLPTSPRERGEVIGCVVNSFTGSQAAAITYADFGNEVLGRSPARADGVSPAAQPPRSLMSPASRAWPRSSQRNATAHAPLGAPVLWRWIDRDRQIRDSQTLVLGQRHQDDVGIGRIEQGFVLDHRRRTQLVRLLRQPVAAVRNDDLAARKPSQ
jgi:hypothetical protein